MPSPLSTLVHPNMLQSLTPTFFPRTCTILAKEPGVDATGFPIGTWSALAGHIDLPCSTGVPRGSREIRRTLVDFSIKNMTISLSGYYPGVTWDHRVALDGVTYNVLTVDHDAMNTQTYLRVDGTNVGPESA